ncbi:hypothetical protein D3C72_1722340 [compost metagenome]
MPRRKVAGRLKNTGTAPMIAACATENSNTVAITLWVKNVLPAIAIAPTIKGTMMCQRRSRMRSELVPISNIPSRAATLGNAVSRPMVVMLVTPAVLIKVGIQKPMA